MATIYNKPDVYVEETLTPTMPVAATSSNSVAVFIGATDRGPTTVNANSYVVGVPTLIPDWSTFINKFSFGSTASTFSTTGTTNPNMKYAVKSFFDNGGSQAYILRTPNTDSIKSSISLRDQNASISQTVSYTFSATSTSVTVTAASTTPFSGIYEGTTVTFTGAGIPSTAGSSYTFLTGKSWVVTAASGTAFTVYAVLGSVPSTAVAASGVTVSGPLKNTTASLNVTAKDEGTWGNNVWVNVAPSAVSGYFDLSVYYSTTASVTSDIAESNRVEFFPTLSMNSSDARYAPSVVSSNWVNVSDAGSAATGNAKLPTFTGTWKNTVGSVNLATDGSFTWNKNGFNNQYVKLGAAAANYVSANTAGSAGSAAPSISSVTLPRLDSLTGPLVVNLPAVTTEPSVDAVLDYAGNRGDLFVVIDTEVGVSVSSALSTLSTYTSAYKKYGAAYYPGITVSDPASKTGGTVTIPAGGAVSAIYVATDTSRGVYKAPAGTSAKIASALAVTGLSNSEFDSISSNDTPLNIIRYIPGAGICVMGARTLSNNFAERYVPSRRTLIYLRRRLTALTQFAVFEPNDAIIWAKVTSTLENFLYQFWNQGGLFGASPAAAYYIKCDGDINTSSVRDAGELRIEIGVALQKPAEFVVIKIGQLDGGATVTTSI